MSDEPLFFSAKEHECLATALLQTANDCILIYLDNFYQQHPSLMTTIALRLCDSCDAFLMKKLQHINYSTAKIRRKNKKLKSKTYSECQ
jgi:hypothetical protein